ncbi:MAG TPA: hypothetical protein VMU32_12270 [Solirubrobacteraceae bacterium]|nr:hypothetical protein [Solirubrobacteraceae bacterium]
MSSSHASSPAPPAPRRRSRRARNASVVVLLLLAALLLAACGESETRVTTGTYNGASGKNAPYLNVGPLIYQVQISRELNPWNGEDNYYLQGLTPAQRKLQAGEEWFGVFMQVYNKTTAPHPIATDLTISDTEGITYKPVVPGPANDFAYRDQTVPGNGQVPRPNTPAASGPSQGAVLLYKIKVISLENRPLTLKIVDPADPAQTASAELDV